MTDFSSGAVLDDDLDLGAAKGRAKARESAGAKAAAWGGRGLNVAIGVSAVLVVAGLALWAMQLSGGMVQTGMRNLDSWGLYITSFMFFVGLSAGGLIISSVPKAFGIAGFGGISKVAVMSSIACTVAAIGMVVVDLGQPARLWELFAYSNLGSPLMWDILVLGTYLVLSCVYLWAQVRAEAGRMSHAALRVISVVALVCAVLVHSVTAWIFGLQQGREMWHTALLAPWFVSSALVCGTALVMVVAIGLRKVGYLELDQSYLVKLAKLLGAFVMVDLYFFGCDLLTEAFPGGIGRGGGRHARVRPARSVLLDGDRRLRRLRRHLLRAGAAHQHLAGDRLAARDRGHLLQARATARGRLPDRQPGLRRPPDLDAAHRLGLRPLRHLRGHGLLADTA